MSDLEQGEELQAEEAFGQPLKEKKKKTLFHKGVLTGVLCTLAVVLLIGIGIVTYLKVGLKQSNLLNSSIKTKIEYLSAIIDYYYYEDEDADTMAEGIYKGMVDSLDDPYSTYYTADEYQESLIDTTGEYAGIGALLSQDKQTNVVTIAKVYDGSPADEAGLVEGDTIVSVDGYAATDYALDEFVGYIRGEEGSQVTLMIVHDQGTTQEIGRAHV